MSVTLKFEEAVFGIEQEIEFEREETCSRCNGSGVEPGTSPTCCSTCGGQGEVRQVRHRILGQMMHTAICPTCGGGRSDFIAMSHLPWRWTGTQTCQEESSNPAGVDSGTQIRLAGEGGPGFIADRMEVCFWFWMFSRINSSSAARTIFF